MCRNIRICCVPASLGWFVPRVMVSMVAGLALSCTLAGLGSRSPWHQVTFLLGYSFAAPGSSPLTRSARVLTGQEYRGHCGLPVSLLADPLFHPHLKHKNGAYKGAAWRLPVKCVCRVCQSGPKSITPTAWSRAHVAVACEDALALLQIHVTLMFRG